MAETQLKQSAVYKLEGKNLEEFTGCVKVLSRIIDEGRIKFDASGMTIKETDKALVAYAECNIPASLFTRFDQTEQELGVNFSKFVGALEKFDDSITIELADNKIRLSDGDFAHELSLLDLGTRQLPPMDGLTWKTTLEFDTKKLKTFLEMTEGMDAWLFDLNISRIVAEDDLSVITLTIKEKEDVRVGLTIDYLKKVLAVKSEKLTISLSTDYPAKIESGRLKFIIAPRIIDEDIHVNKKPKPAKPQNGEEEENDEEESEEDKGQ